MSRYEDSPIGYAKKACDTMIRRYSDVNTLPPTSNYGTATFNYHQGVFMTGMSRVYEVCREEKYLNYINDWIHAVQDKDGRIKEYGGWLSLTTLDFRQPANVLAFMYEQTHDPHYVDLMKYLADDLVTTYPRNAFGGFWHFYTTPDQMWVDGIYMAGPLLARYARYSGKSEYLELAIKQIFIMYSNMRDPQTGLLRHGWDTYVICSWNTSLTRASTFGAVPTP